MDDDVETARSEKLSRRKILEKETHLKNLVLETMTFRDEILKYVWDDLIGQTFPAKDARHLVHNVNSRKYKDAAKGMLFYGPPGLGKDVLANIIFYQMNNVTVFDIPHDFGARQPNIWGHLIDIAYEHSPAIIYFNECDGVFKGNTNPQAIKRAWNEGIKTGGYVLMLGSTNGVMKIDGAIVNRFGDPYKFDPLTPDQRCLLIKRKILGSYDEKDEAKADLEAADVAEWMELAELIPVDNNPRWLVVDFIQKVKSTYNYKVGEEGHKTLITLQDFMERLRILPASTTPSFVDTQEGKLVIVQLQHCFEVSIGHVMNIRDVLIGMRCNKNLQVAAGLWAALGLDWKTFVSAPNTHIKPEVQTKLAMCIKEAFPETYGGPRGPKTGDPPVSVYTMDEEWRMKYIHHAADEQMVKLCFNTGKNKKTIGHDGFKKLKYSKYFSNLQLKP